MALLTRREALKYGAIGLGSLALGSCLPFSKAYAYPWNEHVVKPLDFGDIPSIELLEELCSTMPDNVSITGNDRAFVQEISSVPNTSHTFPTTAVIVPQGTLPGSLNVVATFNRVGRHRDSHRAVGVRVYFSNLIKARHDDHQSMIHCDRFWNPGYSIGMWNIESMDIEWEFFYSDNPSEIVSFKNRLATVTSLDGNWPVFGSETRLEGILLPDDVSDIYYLHNTVLEIDSTLSGRQTYNHVIHGVMTTIPSEERHQRTGISWVCPTDRIKAKMIEVSDGIFGFNVTMQPILNGTPSNPIKTAKVVH